MNLTISEKTPQMETKADANDTEVIDAIVKHVFLKATNRQYISRITYDFTKQQTKRRQKNSHLFEFSSTEGSPKATQLNNERL